MKLYEKIAQTFGAYMNCTTADTVTEWEQTIEDLVKEHMPSGSGFDNGTEFAFDDSTPERLVFRSAYHHMNETGYYDGWSVFKIIVTPSLVFGFTLQLRSIGPFNRKYADTKDYILETFQEALDSEVKATPPCS